MKKIEYNQNDFSHVPKSIIYWVSQGIVIQGVRYSIKEFRMEDEKFKLVVENNGEFFEVDVNTSTGSAGTPVDITEKLKDYISVKNMDVDKELVVSQDTTNNNRVRIGVTSELTNKLITDDQKKILDNIDKQYTFKYLFGTYSIHGNPTGEADNLDYVTFAQCTNGGVDVWLDATNGSGVTLHNFLSGNNTNHAKLTKITVLETGETGSVTIPESLDDSTYVSVPLTNPMDGKLVQVKFSR